MWLECKKPNAGAVYDCMRHTRRTYHSAIRRTRQIEKDIRKEKVAEHCHEKSAKNFWQCIMRINTSGEYLPSKIDNEVDTQQIAENFGEKYRLLYTKVPTDPMEIETLSNILDSLCVNCNMGECRVTALDVRKAISKLKSGKSDGIDGFMSDHIIHASDKFFVIVGMLINAMLTPDGHNPVVLCESVAVEAVIVPSPFGSEYQLTCNYRWCCRSTIHHVEFVFARIFLSFFFSYIKLH